MLQTIYKGRSKMGIIERIKRDRQELQSRKDEGEHGVLRSQVERSRNPGHR